jgi:hypothetical protein
MSLSFLSLPPLLAIAFPPPAQPLLFPLLLLLFPLLLLLCPLLLFTRDPPFPNPPNPPNPESSSGKKSSW